MIFISVPTSEDIRILNTLYIYNPIFMDVLSLARTRRNKSDTLRDLDDDSCQPHEYGSLLLNMRSEITLTEMEQAINYWRLQRPSLGEECALSPEVNVLASIYALMIFNRVKSLPVDKIDTVSLQLVDVWRNSGN